MSRIPRPAVLCVLGAGLPAIEMIRVVPGDDGVQKRTVAEPAMLGLLVVVLIVAVVIAVLVSRGSRRPPPPRRGPRYR